MPLLLALKVIWV